MTIKSAAVLGTEDAQAFFVRSGAGIFTFHMGLTAMSVLRQTATGQVTVMTVSAIGEEAECRLILDGWPAASRHGLVEEIIGAIDAALESNQSRFTGNQTRAFAQFADHLRGF